jgi:hypothetical protein
VRTNTCPVFLVFTTHPAERMKVLRRTLRT